MLDRGGMSLKEGNILGRNRGDLEEEGPLLDKRGKRIRYRRLAEG